MQIKRSFDIQKAIDGIIDKIFLRFIPHNVKPNQVTAIRFILIPVIIWLLIQDALGLALFVFIIAASTDFIDGAMARTRNQITDLGKVIDPVADKLLILTVLMYIGFNFIIVKIFVIFIIFELLAVIIGYYFSFAIGKPIGANFFGKIKLILQCLSVGFFLLGIIISNMILINISKYVLFAALFFAVMAAIETGRRKVRNYLSDHDIDVIYS